MHVAVVVFPGTNCEQDTVRAVELAGGSASLVWHRATSLDGADAVILPGGFSYGDYLRSGAIARFSPIMNAIVRHAAGGGPVVGICNGFQILCEAGLLPGALARNIGLRFTSRSADVIVHRSDTVVTGAWALGTRLRWPVANGEGRFVADPRTLARLRDNAQIVFTYAPDPADRLFPGNPSGSMGDIAGICSPSGTVVGCMPHPERVADPLISSGEGAPFFTSLLTSLVGSTPAGFLCPPETDRP